MTAGQGWPDAEPGANTGRARFGAAWNDTFRDNKKFNELRVAVSEDGLGFRSQPDILAPWYLRAFRREDAWYGIGMPNLLLRSPEGLTPFETGPEVLPASTRHTGLFVPGDTLHLFWGELHETPERIHHGCMPMHGDWRDWRLRGRHELLRAQSASEGAGIPAVAAAPGAGDELSNAPRDPYPFVDDEHVFLFYAGGGERGIGIAELTLGGNHDHAVTS